VVSALVTAWRNQAAYPPGHPARTSALATAHGRLRAYLAASSPLVFGIAREGLSSGDQKLSSAHVQAFARTLYRRNAGLLKIEDGVELRELEGFLTALGDAGAATRERAFLGDEIREADIRHITISTIDYSALVTTSEVGQSPSQGSLWDELMRALLAERPMTAEGGPPVGRGRTSAETIASLFRGGPGEGGAGTGAGSGTGTGPGGAGAGGSGSGSGPGGAGPGGTGVGGRGGGLAMSVAGRGGGRGGLGPSAVSTLANAVGAHLAAALGPDRDALIPQVTQLLRSLPAEVREPVLASALRVLATEGTSAAHLASLVAALPPADVLRGLRRLAREQGQLSGHALRMAQALAETQEGLPGPALPEPPADFGEMAALFREEDVDRYNPEDHRALLAQKPTVDLAAISLELAEDPDAFGPDTESDDAIERRVITTLVDMVAVSPDVARPLVLGRLREIFLRALQAERFAQAISIIRAVRELAEEPGHTERGQQLGEFLDALADAEAIGGLVAASRQPGGPPFVQVQTLVLALGASAARGILGALAVEPDRVRRMRLIELAASLGPAIVPDTSRMLSDARWYVVRNMVLLLRRVQDRSSMTEIRRCVDHPDLRVRLEAIRALFAFDPKVPQALLARTIQNPDPRIAEAAVLLIGQHGITQAVDLLVEILLRWDLLRRRRSLRLKALRALGDLADPAVLPRLDRFFRGWSIPPVALEERRAAYRHLAGYDETARAPYVTKGQRSRDPIIRDICRGLALAARAGRRPERREEGGA
jgi:hypothetical protein